MGDSYVECLVSRNRENKYQIIKIVMYVLAGICILLALMGIPFLFIAGVAIGVAGIFAVPSPDIEYEYLYINKELSIDKIIEKSKRKAVASYDLNKMEVMCPVNSHELDSYKSKNLPIKNYASNMEDAKNYAIVYRDEKTECIVYITPNEELKQAIKTVFPRKLVEY